MISGFNRELFNLQIVLVPVKKKDGRTRGVTDLRLLNDVTIKDAYPLANIQENLQKLKGAKIFTSIDACGAYHCIQIKEGSSFYQPFWDLAVYLYAFWHVKYRQCLQPDVGSSPWLIYLLNIGYLIWMIYSCTLWIPGHI